MKREEIYKVIDSERDYQTKRWGGDSHDSEKSVGDFILYMQNHLAKSVGHYSSDDDSKQTLNELRKVVALGIACFEIHGVEGRNEYHNK